MTRTNNSNKIWIQGQTKKKRENKNTEEKEKEKNMKKRMMAILTAAVASSMVFMTAGAEEVKGSGETLTVYSNSVSDGRGDWLTERAAQDGFDIQYVDLAPAEMLTRLNAEKYAPIADVAFGMYTSVWETLKKQELLTAYKPVWADEVSEGLNDKEDYYHAIVKQAILLIYDKNQLGEADAPTDWPDLWTNEAYTGKYEWTSTGLGGATPRHVLTGILSRYRDDEGKLGISDEGWEQIAAYYQNGMPSEEGVDLYAHIADTDNPVVLGQIWSSGIAARDEQYGTDTGYVTPECGIPYLVESVGIISGSEKQEEAQRFVDWFGSAQIQGEWAQQFSTLPANTNAVSMANEFNQEIADLPAQDIDWSFVTDHLDDWCEEIELNYIP